MDEALPILKKVLSEGRLSIFAGSGISVESGLPAWDGFVDKYIEICEKLNESLDSCDQFTDIINDAKINKDKNLISTITALKGKIKEVKMHGINTDFCEDMLSEFFFSAKPCDYHEIIVSTNYKHIITTNYDNLLEQAASKEGYTSLLTKSYSYTEQQNLSMAIYSGKMAIIHAHGKIANIKLDEFILTEDDYLAIMKHNPGFRLIINSVFLTNSVIFAGYGGSDPHFEDIVSDLNMTLNWNSKGRDLPRCYIMLKKDKVTPIREFLSDKHRVDIITFEEYSQMKDFLRELEKCSPRPKP